MVFKGDLESVPLGDVLQTLYQNAKSGTLEIVTPEYTKNVYCSPEGITLPDPEIEKPRRLGDIVVTADLGTRSVVERVCQEKEDNQLLGQALVDQGLITQEIISRITRIQVEEEIYTLFKIKSGDFEFHEDEDTSFKERGYPIFNIESVALEAARRQDEWPRVMLHVPDLNTVFFPTTKAYEGEDASFTMVLEKVDGIKTVMRIADSLLTAAFNVAKIMAALTEQEYIRPAENEEMLTIAQTLLDQDEIEDAGAILKKLRPDLKNLLLHSSDVTNLADLFYKVGDILTATNLLLDKVRQSKGSSILEESLPFLKQAHRIAPEDTRILKELVEICEQSGDHMGKLQHMISLAHVHIKSEQYSEALAICHSILAIDPVNSFVIQNMPDYMVNVGSKQEAVGFLEEIIGQLNKKTDPNDIAKIYRKILKIDPSRKDIHEKLKKALKRAKGMSKTFQLTIASVVMIALCGAVYPFVGNQTRESDMNRVEQAALLMCKGQMDEAQALLDLNVLADPDAINEANRLLTAIANKRKDVAKVELDNIKTEYYTELKTIHEMMDSARFIDALTAIKALGEKYDKATFCESLKAETSNIYRGIQDEVKEMEEKTENFSAPTQDEQLQGFYEKYSTVVTPSKCQRLKDLPVVLEELSSDEYFQYEKMDDLVACIKSASDSMDAKLLVLETVESKLMEFNSLESLSRIYTKAEEAEREGRLPEALELYTELVEGYGNRRQKHAFVSKKEKLEKFFRITEEVEKLARAREITQAYDMALDQLKEFPESTYAAFIKIPIMVKSFPEGAKIRSLGRSLGTTPKLIFLQDNQHMNMTLEYEGFDHQLLVLEKEAGPEQLYCLNRKVAFAVRLGGFIEGSPLLSKRGLILPSRNGVIFQINHSNGAITKKFNSGSLSGIPSSVLEAHGSYYFTTMEGELWAMDPEKLEKLEKIDLGSGTGCQPVAVKSGVITACHNGRVTCHAQNISEENWSFQGVGKIVVPPLCGEDKLVVSFPQGDVVCLNAQSGSLIWRKKIQSGDVESMAVSNGLLYLCSNNGGVRALGFEDGKKKWSRELDSFINLAPGIWKDSLYVASNKKIFEMNKNTGDLIHQFSVTETITSSPVVFEDHICFGVKDGKVHYRKIRTEQDIWNYQSAGAITSAPLITEDKIYITDASGQLSAILR